MLGNAEQAGLRKLLGSDGPLEGVPVAKDMSTVHHVKRSAAGARWRRLGPYMRAALGCRKPMLSTTGKRYRVQGWTYLRQGHLRPYTHPLHLTTDRLLSPALSHHRRSPAIATPSVRFAACHQLVAVCHHHTDYCHPSSPWLSLTPFNKTKLGFFAVRNTRRRNTRRSTLIDR